NNLAHAYHAQGAFDEAEKSSRQSLALSFGQVQRASAFLSERRLLNQVEDLRTRLDSYLSVARDRPGSWQHAYEALVVSKGTGFARQQRLGRLRRLLNHPGNAELAKLFHELDETVSQLATQALATPQPAARENWRKNLAALTDRKDRLEATLAERS